MILAFVSSVVMGTLSRACHLMLRISSVLPGIGNVCVVSVLGVGLSSIPRVLMGCSALFFCGNLKI